MTWSVAIVTSRESLETLARTIAAVVAAASADTTIDVVTNGAWELAESVGRFVASERLKVSVWHVPIADKALAWNQYIHQIHGGEDDVVFFIDGYIRVNRDALHLMSSELSKAPDALGASGVPTKGPSAAGMRTRMKNSGGFHGNLCAVTGPVLHNLRVRGFRFPLGLYRVDSLLGAVLCFNFDPAHHEWNSERIRVCFDASWDYDAPRLSIGSIHQYARRKLRQEQGYFENKAVRSHLAQHRFPPETLPPFSAEMVANWVKKNPHDAKKMLHNPIARVALRRIMAPRDWSAANSLPILISKFRN
jgi:hypothetical protein